jgi:hypothetical protein
MQSSLTEIKIYNLHKKMDSKTINNFFLLVIKKDLIYIYILSIHNTIISETSITRS